MSQKESTLTQMVVTLFVITFLASAALGFVYNVTKEPIAKAKMAKKIIALQKVLPAFDNTPVQETQSAFVDGDSLRFYLARKEGKLVGVAIETFSPNGFGGLVKLMVGFLPDGTIYKTAVLEHKETPGLGDKMVAGKSDFPLQFEGKNPKDFRLQVGKDGGDVDAITASTISSRAFCDAVQRAYNQLNKQNLQ